MGALSDFRFCASFASMSKTETIKIHCLFDKMVPVAELRPNPRNANKHPQDQIERLAEILKYQGWRYPIKVSNRSGLITSGHGRLLAAKLLGMKEVPVNFQDYDSDDMEAADLHADNAIASWAEVDMSGINTDLGNFGPDFDINMLGIKKFVLDASEFAERQEEEPPKEMSFLICPNCETPFEKGQAKKAAGLSHETY